MHKHIYKYIFNPCESNHRDIPAGHNGHTDHVCNYYCVFCLLLIKMYIISDE